MAGRILVVDDDREITRALTRLLSRSGYFVSAAHSSEEALSVLSSDSGYDMVILDIGLPGQDGNICCNAIRQMRLRMPVLMLTGRNASWDKVTGLENGADDYITKPVDPRELMARVRSHLRRWQDYNGTSAPEEQREIAPGILLDENIRDIFRDGVRCELTEREYELLVLMVRSPDRALAKEWLYQEIWGCAPTLGIKVLAVYVRRLRQKIEDDADNPQLVKTVRGHGYMFQSNGRLADAENDADPSGSLAST